MINKTGEFFFFLIIALIAAIVFAFWSNYQQQALEEDPRLDAKAEKLEQLEQRVEDLEQNDSRLSTNPEPDK